MKAMIFAAGLGTRLRPLTNNCPKALIEVGGEVMLGRVLRRVVEAGVNEAVVNVHHLPQMIVDYLAANNNFGITIHVSREDEMLLDTGGGLLAARDWLDGEEDILVHNADIFTNVDLKSMVAAHVATDADATLMAWERSSSRVLLVDSSGRMRGWSNLVTGEVRPENATDRYGMLRHLAFGGVHVVSPRIFSELDRYSSHSGSVFSITPFYTEVCRQLYINTYSPPPPLEWADIGRPEALNKLRNKYPSYQ